jgi:hypothetical protein
LRADEGKDPKWRLTRSGIDEGEVRRLIGSALRDGIDEDGPEEAD